MIRLLVGMLNVNWVVGWIMIGLLIGLLIRLLVKLFIILLVRLLIRLLIRGGFLIRRSSAIRRFFAGFLRCDHRTIIKSYLKEIAREFSGNFVGFLCKFPVNLRVIFLRNDFIIVRLSHFRNPAINLRIAELRLMRNPPLIVDWIVGWNVNSDYWLECLLGCWLDCDWIVGCMGC